MRKETTVRAASVEEAKMKAALELGVEADWCACEVLETKKGLFGKIKEVVVRVSFEQPEAAEAAPEAPVQEKDAFGEKISSGEEAVSERAPLLKEEGGQETESAKLKIAREYLTGIMQAMELTDVTLRIEEKEDGAVITFEGDGIAVLIGHHGETLDALQYLVALTCNRIDGEYYRITLDCGNYREKREATLQALAARIAAKVKKTGRSQLLEPMNPYERRIIHAVVSDIEGVYSKSKGEEPNRRVVILSETPVKSNYRGGHRDYKKPSYSPRQRERTMEEILKSDFKEKEESAELYSKLEL